MSIMKISNSLYSIARPLWDVASEKSFLAQMADGTLSQELFRNYMIQDYLYLKEYIDILNRILKLAEDDELRTHVKDIINEVEKELEVVHIPTLKSLGVDASEADGCKQEKAFADYIKYMNSSLEEHGLRAGITSLLQCSWNYAYVAKKVSDKYADTLEASPYKSWFDAYTGPEYNEANQLWIDTLDKETEGIDEAEKEKLCNIFKKCAEFENGLWDALAKGPQNN